MLGETKNQFSLTRVASSTCGRMKSNFLSVYQFTLPSNPPGSRYGMCLQEIKLQTKD